MADLSPEFIATAKRMGVPLPPRRRPRFFSSVRSYFRFGIDWTGELTAGPPTQERLFLRTARRDIKELARITATPPLHFKP